MKALHRDPYTGLWKYGNSIVSLEDKNELEIDLVGAEGEIKRWQETIQNIKAALAQIDDDGLEGDLG